MKLDLQSVQGTMLIPLWGRATASEKNPEILYDKEAIEIIAGCHFDFTEIAKTFGEYGGISYLVRARKMEDTIRKFINKHPRATIVNIGSGLDTTFSRVDNGTINWYNLDLPDAIAFRQSLIPDTPRNSSIAKSFFDVSWFDDVIFNKEDGILFISAGVFYYFQESQLKEIFQKMSLFFPGGEMYFDAESKMMLNISNRTVEKTGNKGAKMYFYVNNPKALEGWSPNIKLLSSVSYFKGIPARKEWESGTRVMVRLIDLFKLLKFIHLGFEKEN
ncbi:class I SAM-dependent methyltransferase [Neobacillus sp. MER 74]|uniref:class I SAM-dependent methyltransferase n=1 Tax=Neobacillus sp. MER 74 TaxID=2939566 RepID=UPI00203EC1A6|nr:class I SAM-dependent methyltransferase [Neobacillus sp. MER 74]MCM3117417.1 class I SAM-dependent methyltransferase [Neobacillus sp. MER 74]